MAKFSSELLSERYLESRGSYTEEGNIAGRIVQVVYQGGDGNLITEKRDGFKLFVCIPPPAIEIARRILFLREQVMTDAPPAHMYSCIREIMDDWEFADSMIVSTHAPEGLTKGRTISFGAGLGATGSGSMGEPNAPLESRQATRVQSPVQMPMLQGVGSGPSSAGSSSARPNVPNTLHGALHSHAIRSNPPSAGCASPFAKTLSPEQLRIISENKTRAAGRKAELGNVLKRKSPTQGRIAEQDQDVSKGMQWL